jgi:NitT/TauT family transport system permease protein
MPDSRIPGAAPDYYGSASDADIEAAAALAAKRRKQVVGAWRWIILAAFLGLWEALARAQAIDEFFYSSPAAIAVRLSEWMVEGVDGVPLWYHLYVTLLEALLGFLGGALAGVAAAVALGRNPIAADVFSFYVKVISGVPPVVLAPIFIMIFGLGLGSKVALSFTMVFFVVFANAFQGVREAERTLLANARILGASGWQLTRAVIIPSAVSWTFASLHLSFGFAVIGAIVGEFVGARYGIGLLINVAKGTFDSAGMYAAIFIVMAATLAASRAMAALENRIARWRPSALRDGG